MKSKILGLAVDLVKSFALRPGSQVSSAIRRACTSLAAIRTWDSS